MAANLIDVYNLALENDPTFKAAYTQYLSQREALPQARAALLPQLTFQAQTGRHADAVRLVHNYDVQDTYNSNQWTLNASQAIFNGYAWQAINQAEASVKAALATYNDATQDLILRTSQAYFDILLARDSLQFALAKKRANARQLEQAKQRLKVGLDSITDVYQAQAAFDQSVAQVIEAENQLSNTHDALSKLTNQTGTPIADCHNDKMPISEPNPHHVDAWITTSLKQNYTLLSATYTLQAARDNIKAQSGKNWPIFAIAGTTTTTHDDIKNNTLSAFNTFDTPNKQSTSSIALTVNIPIFQGGLLVSQTRQADYQFQTKAQNVEKIVRDITANTRITFNSIIAGISRTKADRQTLLSQQKALESVQAQYDSGTRTLNDVVDAQEKLYEAQEQLAVDQYALLIATLRLKYLAGTLSVLDLQEINAWLR
jgi:outer membrane protein